MASTTEPSSSAPEQQGVGLGPDGEKIVDPSYYELLGVKGNADDAVIKKAYRKMAMRYHPDKNPGDETAAAKFQEISEAYAILSDSNSRAVYNKQGKKSAMGEAGGPENMPDPGEIFASLFGGKAFEDWVGEISLGKDVSKAFEMSTTEEEREQMKAELNAESSGSGAGTKTAPAPQSTIHHESFDDVKATLSAGATKTDPFVEPLGSGSKGPATTSTATTNATAAPSFSSSSGDGANAATASSTAEAAAKKEERRKMTAEQREKMEQYDKERAEEKKERVRVLTQKLRDRVRPFVEARNPGANDDPETTRFAERIKEETQDLAMESFGVEICHLIGTIYMSKANSYMKLHKKAGNVLGVAGWWSRVKEKGTMLKEGWSFLSVGLEVSRAMQDFEKRQENGEVPEDEMKALESDLSGKMLLVAWKGSKFELSAVLRQVVDGALQKESAEITDEKLMLRAKGIFLVGAILKAVKPSDEDDERRELERLVEEANRKRKEKPVKPKKVK